MGVKNKRFLVGVGIVLMVGFLFSSGVKAWEEPKAEFVFKCQTSWPKGASLTYLQFKTLDFIEHWTHGRVKFERYTGGEIVPSFEVWKAVEKGVLDCGLACTCYSMDRNWASGMFCSSVGLGPVEKMAFYHGDYPDRPKDIPKMWEYLQKIIRKDYNVIVLPSALQTTEVFLYSKKPINSIEDLKKLKIRSVGVRGDVFRYAGCSVIGMPAGEVVAAMERGVIDACEFANLFGDVDLGFADVAKYIYLTPLRAVPCDLTMMWNPKVWEKLPDDVKKKIEEACFEAMKWSLAECLFRDFQAMKTAEEKCGAKVLPLPKEVDAYILKKADEMYHERAKKDKDLAGYVEALDKFMAAYGKYIPLVDDLL
ncbi:MAG: hypothetical protein DRG40_07000 [Deltaproteobacteria bacterium]|nr:MAG: hypothetical protein DRG40_07000 [Deltaproteobacteria bacterium]